LPDAPKASKKAIGLRDKDVQAQRQAMFRAAIRKRADIARELDRVYQSVESILDQAKLINGRLDATSKRKLIKETGKQISESMSAITEIHRKEVTTAMNRSMVAQNTALKKLGLPPLSTKEREAILNKHLKTWEREEFPPQSKMYFTKRMAKHRALLGKKILHEVSGDLSKKGLDRVKSNTRLAINGKTPGRTPVKGGSTYKQMHRMMVAEQARKANDVALEMLNVAGVEFAYWTLHADHKWYGGKEICEVHSWRVPPITRAKFRELGISAASVDMQGLYPLNNYPKIPHPFCKCSPTPFFK
jgi:hypothetical protein